MKKDGSNSDVVVFSFRINFDDYRMVKLIAENEKRSINKQLEIFLSAGLRDYQRTHPDAIKTDAPLD